jgi:Bacterial regulatory proteins, luxR family
MIVISAKTVSVHISHILRKLGRPNRLEAAATIHRLAPRPLGHPNCKAGILGSEGVNSRLHRSDRQPTRPFRTG